MSEGDYGESDSGTDLGDLSTSATDTDQRASGSSSDSEISLLAPYSYEPSESESDNSEPEESSSEDSDSRLTDTSWCQCSHCTIMDTSEECICCKEVTTIVNKIDELDDSSVQCITEHPGFNSVCLDVWVLQTAYFQYRQQYGITEAPVSLHEKYRYTAYRQLTRWCWGWLGRRLRVVLPSCAVKKIRETFPSESYTGFNYPTL